MIDEYLKKTKGLHYDKNGIIASSGNINQDIINHFYEHEFYNAKEKHSYDRKEFDFNFVTDKVLLLINLNSEISFSFSVPFPIR